MSQDDHRVDPENEPGGYGTPTPEQEMPGQGDERETPERPDAKGSGCGPAALGHRRWPGLRAGMPEAVPPAFHPVPCSIPCVPCDPT